MKIAVLIPCYNEGRTIAKVVEDFRTALPDSNVYVYDNNSTDNTVEEACRVGAIVCHECRQGKGNVVRRMLRDIDADCYLLVDGDDTYPAEHARQMCCLVEKGADLVVGDRLRSTYYKENKRMFHNTGNRLVLFLVNQIFHSNLHDIMTGYRAMSFQFAKNMPIVSRGFEIETEMTMHALDKNYVIEEIPVAYRNRSMGSVSKLNTFTDGIKVIGTVFRMFRDYKPFLFFSILSAIMLLAAIALFVPVFAEYLHTGLVPRFPTLIVSGFMFMASLLTFFCGVILEVVAQKHRQLYELVVNNRK